ncbi:MAG: hypothetical protein F6K55_20940 [Moorea sp. SIO4A3]|nr:hypothetical protein [Moorena sp. SIO4A3]
MRVSPSLTHPTPHCLLLACLLPIASLFPIPYSLFPIPFAHDTINPEDARKCQTNIPTVL